MGVITFDYSNPNGTGTDFAPSFTLRAQLYQREVVSGRIRTVEQFPIEVKAGHGSAVLSDTGANQAWVIHEPSGLEKFVPSTFIKVAGDAEYTACERVDPKTFEPLVPFPASADEVLTEAAAARDDAQSAASAASSSAGSAAGSATDAAGSLAALIAQKGADNGVAPLDGTGLLPDARVPLRLTATELNAMIATVVDAATEAEIARADAAYITPNQAAGIAAGLAFVLGA